MRTKKWILIICAGLLGLPVMASDRPSLDVTQNVCLSATGTKLTGQVVDRNTHEPLVGAKVKIVDCNIEVYTDFDGNFSFDRISEGEHILQVEYVSYETRFTTVLLNNEAKSNQSVILLKNARN
jgi:hypothetical protein